MTKAFLITLILGISISTSALGQQPAAAPAAAPSPSTEAPAPAAAPAPPAAEPAPVAVPPGYKLVPITEPDAPTRYDVQYPQMRGALPPGMEIPYEDGDTIPAGYRLREQPRRGLIIGGSIMTGIPWVFSVTGAVGNDFEDNSGFLLLPAVGPWLMLATGGASDEECSSPSGLEGYCSGDRSGLRAILVLNGLVQTAGATMFVLGLKYPRKRLVREDVTVGFAPTPLGRDGYGVGALGTF
jgi:hypothetical protein